MNTKAALISGLIITIVGGLAVELIRKNFLPSKDEVNVQIDFPQDQNVDERIRELEEELAEEKAVQAEVEQRQRRLERRLRESRSQLMSDLESRPYNSRDVFALERLRRKRLMYDDRHELDRRYREIIDRYNQTAKAIIDEIGR